MEKPPPDPVKLLGAWMEWERGENPPGRVISNLKTAGMRELLEELAAKTADPAGGNGGQAPGQAPGQNPGQTPGQIPGEGEPPSAEAWTPVV